jgi:hypothetical protein
MYLNCSLHCQCHTTATVDVTRLAPCAEPTLCADEAVLLALLAAVHDGRRRPAHTLAHQPVRSPRFPRDATWGCPRHCSPHRRDFPAPIYRTSSGWLSFGWL